LPTTGTSGRGQARRFRFLQTRAQGGGNHALADGVDHVLDLGLQLAVGFPYNYEWARDRIKAALVRKPLFYVNLSREVDCWHGCCTPCLQSAL
jgi:hypothetical protein